MCCCKTDSVGDCQSLRLDLSRGFRVEWDNLRLAYPVNRLDRGRVRCGVIGRSAVYCRGCRGIGRLFINRIPVPGVPVFAITIGVELAVLAHNVAHCLFKRLVMVLGGQGKDISSVAEELMADASVDVEALRDSHAQARQHHGYEAAGAGAIHIVEVVAWQQLVFVKVAAVAARYRPLLFL